MPLVGPYGSTSGTSQGPGTGSQTDRVTKIVAYGSSAYVYGLRVYWGSTRHVMFGQENGVTGEELDLQQDSIKEVKYLVTAGVLRGIKFKTKKDNLLEAGLAPVTSTAFSGNYDLTDLVAYKGAVNGTMVIWGISFYYKAAKEEEEDKASSSLTVVPSELAWPSLAVMAHTMVVMKSLKEVGKLRKTLDIKAPSCDPSLTTSPSNTQLWYRTFRAQENCKEMFLVYLPSILIASSLGHHAFGKWAPRVVGTLAMVGAVFRFRYLKAYIEDADKRGPPFYCSSLCMKPIFYLAVVSCGYLLGKELYRCCIKGCSSKNSKDEEEEKNE